MIHPKDRVPVLIVPRSRSSISDEEDESSGDDSNGGRSLRKRATRQTMTRTRRPTRGSSESFESEYDLSESEPEVRRSGRIGTQKNYNEQMDVDYEVNEESDDDVMEIDSDGSYGRKKAKMPRKRKGPKPAYGRIRRMEDLDVSESALLNHRDTCEKCHRPASSLLLQKLKSRKGSKRKKAQDDFSENDEDFFNNLGGWVRWSVNSAEVLNYRSSFSNDSISASNVVSFHTGVASQNLKEMISSELFRLEPSRKATLDHASVTSM